MQITIEHKDVGNARRGYHNTDSTITFDYGASGSYYDMKREKEIIDFILGRNHLKMWFSYKHEEEITDKRTVIGTQHPYEIKTKSIYVVNHGFDSGD